jgi:hypothetical protein
MKVSLIRPFYSVLGILLILSACATAENKPRTITGSVTGNSYRLNMGIGLISKDDPTVGYFDTPHSDLGFQYTITVNQQGSFYLAYYIDENNNGSWDLYSSGRNDSYYYLWPTAISLYNNSVKDISLKAKLIIGTNSGADVNEFNRVQMNHMTASVTNGAYALRYYMLDYVTNNDAGMKLFKDMNNNYALDTAEAVVYYPATNIITGTNTVTNVFNYQITKTIAHLTTNGSAAGYAYPKILEQVSGKIYTLQDRDITNFWNRSGTNAVVYIYSAFNDSNNNNKNDPGETAISTNDPSVPDDTAETDIILFLTN